MLKAHKLETVNRNFSCLVSCLEIVSTIKNCQRENVLFIENMFRLQLSKQLYISPLIDLIILCV